MRVCYVGNHGSAVGLGAGVDDAEMATTEAHWAGSLELLGHEVVRMNEESTSWADRLRVAQGCDLFLWTSTWGFNERWPLDESYRAIRHLRALGIPTASLHLDRWRGLSNREWQVTDRQAGSAMFACDFVFTADGDADDWYRSLDVNHFWLPPGVYEPECCDGTPWDEWRSDVAFIGGWQHYGHAEHWEYRRSMLDALRDHYESRVAFWPRPGEAGPWGMAYNDLLASVKVVVGDSWRGADRYYSNRVHEVIGRGGFCVHPIVPGLVELLPPGMGVAYFPAGDWDAMCETIDWWVARDDRRAAASREGQAYVRKFHTYSNRLTDALAIMDAEGAWS